MTLTMIQLFIKRLNINQKTNVIITLWSNLYEALLLGEFDNREYWLFLIMIVGLQFWFIQDDQNKQDLQKKNLQNYQNKMREDFYWKKIIEKFY